MAGTAARARCWGRKTQLCAAMSEVFSQAHTLPVRLKFVYDKRGVNTMRDRY